jgi:diguanylate cyclase (GGDEF)-like protein/PAS domain S-box-containing protein
MPREDGYTAEIVAVLDEAVYYVDRSRTIRLWNPAAERLTGYASEDVVGRRCWDGILAHTDGVGRPLCRGNCPLAQTMVDGQRRRSEVFLRDKSGQRRLVAVRTAPILDASGVIVGAVETFVDGTSEHERRTRLEELERQALVDPLTGIGNRRYLESNLRARLEELQRYEWRFGVLFVDLDHFKRINDTFGHDVGDQVLRLVAKTLGQISRAGDSVGRWGGEEFLLIASNADERALDSAAERLRSRIAESVTRHRTWDIRITASIGGASARCGDTLESVVARADAAMYRSKVSGRNQAHFVHDGSDGATELSAGPNEPAQSVGNSG